MLIPSRLEFLFAQFFSKMAVYGEDTKNPTSKLKGNANQPIQTSPMMRRGDKSESTRLPRAHSSMLTKYVPNSNQECSHESITPKFEAWKHSNSCDKPVPMNYCGADNLEKEIVFVLVAAVVKPDCNPVSLPKGIVSQEHYHRRRHFLRSDPRCLHTQAS